ncbi:MAG: malic enzyme-like NAD(P)-binding protein [Nanoarchaeota archaeon]|nr:malic enzyme-like NAD(P)-binding protein [Nanoarchaeota archaeon]
MIIKVSMDIKEESLKIHDLLKGKLSVNSKIPLNSKLAFSLAYTPGVAEPCKKIAEDKELAYKYTIKGNCVAVISNGTAVLGLGNIGATAGIPVMEGKAAIFKELGGIDAFPICIDSGDVEENIKTIRNIAPVFGGINLEDYKAPECFEIEAGLQDLGIPVMHDDQHGTAIVVLAGLINSLKLAGKEFSEVKIIFSGAGSAAIACAKLLISYGANSGEMILCDTKGIIYDGRNDLTENKYKEEISKITNSSSIKGPLSEAIKGADVFIGLSKAGVLNKEMIKTMAEKSVIFAMANPEPEVLPDIAKEAGAFIVATGRSDYPNQVNNALGFPGIFRGALDCRATKITEKMKLAAAETLASMIIPTQEKILPFVFDKEVPLKVAEAVKRAWGN